MPTGGTDTSTRRDHDNTSSLSVNTGVIGHFVASFGAPEDAISGGESAGRAPNGFCLHCWHFDRSIDGRARDTHQLRPFRLLGGDESGEVLGCAAHGVRALLAKTRPHFRA